MADGFVIINLGCKVNRIEADNMRLSLLAAGYLEVAASQACVCLINTCTVTAEADAKVRKEVRRAASSAEQVIVTGCSAAINAEKLTSLAKNVHVIADRSKALEAALHNLGAQRSSDLDRVATSYQYLQRVGKHYPTRVGVKVQDGCSNRCSYCIVPQARGAARSRPLTEIIAECQGLLAAGACELVISGINVGAYHDGKHDLVDLLSILSSLPGEFRLRLSSIEPQDVSDQLLALFSQPDQRLCRHLHIPLQSGSDKILRQMNRRYNRTEFLELVSHARSQIPNLALTTDCIVGFPEEDDEDFQATCSAARSACFSGIHVFRYSQRPGTPAATRPQIPAAIRTQRAQELRALAENLTHADQQLRIGIVEQVVMEDAQCGRGESYHRVQLASAKPIGKLITVRYTGHTKNVLLAEQL